MIWSIENWKPWYYLYNLLAPQSRAVELEPKFHTLALSAPSKSFWHRLQPPKIVWTLSYGSTTLVLGAWIVDLR